MKDLISFMQDVADGLQNSGNLGTAHIYRSSLNAIRLFLGTTRFSFEELTPEWLKRFEINLRSRGCSWNTVSTYLRTLRAVYHRAVNSRKTDYVPLLFHSVYTGTRADHQRALDGEDLRKVFGVSSCTDTLSCGLRRARELFMLTFMLRGLPFVDLAYLRKSDLQGNVISYRRRKTGRPLSVTLTREAMILLQRYRNRNESSPYLFEILRSHEGTAEAYHEYQLALRRFNSQLALLGNILGASEKLSSYTARHTWATTAYYCEVHPGVISEAMGHSSITVTETYLKPFRSKKIDEANGRIIEFIRQSAGMVVV